MTSVFRPSPLPATPRVSPAAGRVLEMPRRVRGARARASGRADGYSAPGPGMPRFRGGRRRVPSTGYSDPGAPRRAQFEAVPRRFSFGWNRGDRGSEIFPPIGSGFDFARAFDFGGRGRVDRRIGGGFDFAGVSDFGGFRRINRRAGDAADFTRGSGGVEQASTPVEPRGIHPGGRPRFPTGPALRQLFLFARSAVSAPRGNRPGLRRALGPAAAPASPAFNPAKRVLRR